MDRSAKTSMTMNKRLTTLTNHSKPGKIALVLFGLVVILLGAFSYLAAPASSKPVGAEIDSWQSTTALPEGLANRNTVVHGDQLYVIGGKMADNRANNNIYSATINADGSLGAWRTAGQLPLPHYLFTTVVAGDVLFLIGGWDGNKTVNHVWRATFDGSGNVGNWAAMPAYPVALDLHDAVLIDGHIYSVGGWDSFKPLQSVYAAAVTATGLSDWQLVGNLPKALYRHAVTGANGFLYVTGGYDANNRGEATVLVAKVNGTSALGGWQTPPALPALTYYHTAVIHDGRLVVLGGRNDAAPSANVYSTGIGADGLTGTWQAETALPVALYRFGAATVTRNGSDYLYVTAGLRSESDYQAAVYHSTVPELPTPTATATPTATPVPKSALSLVLRNTPQSWIAPGGQVTYIVDYQNSSSIPLRNVEVANVIPAGAELVENSVRSSAGTFTIAGTQAGATITWQLGDVPANGRGQVAYTVQRLVPPTPVVPLALGVAISAPATAAAEEQITYQLEVINRAPIPLTNLVVTNTLPAGATYLSGGDGAPTNGIVQWSIPALAADTSTTLDYRVHAENSLVNYDYRATSSEGASARGRTLAVTIVDGQPPFTGDGFVLTNGGATAIWAEVQGVGGMSNRVYNPSFTLYLPTVQDNAN
jgi:uncharacterized repeat protein (TIGR01451 family)